jgi:hypothetical protein
LSATSRLYQWLLWKRNRARRVRNFRAALAALPEQTNRVAWWWDEINRLGVEAEKDEKKKSSVAFYTGQKYLLEWLLSGCGPDAPKVPE